MLIKRLSRFLFLILLVAAAAMLQSATLKANGACAMAGHTDAWDIHGYQIVSRNDSTTVEANDSQDCAGLLWIWDQNMAFYACYAYGATDVHFTSDAYFQGIWAWSTNSYRNCCVDYGFC